jgi:hypothetical protein
MLWFCRNKDRKTGRGILLGDACFFTATRNMQAQKGYCMEHPSTRSIQKHAPKTTFD